MEHPLPISVALLDEEVIIGDFSYWRGRTSDGTRLVTVLQSKAWHAYERYLDELMRLSGHSVHNRYTHPAWRETYAIAHDADLWQHYHDGASVIVTPANP